MPKSLELTIEGGCGVNAADSRSSSTFSKFSRKCTDVVSGSQHVTMSKVAYMCNNLKRHLTSHRRIQGLDIDDMIEK